MRTWNTRHKKNSTEERIGILEKEKWRDMDRRIWK
jgi:hypothetical protein